VAKEPVKFWRYYLPSENGEGYAIIFIDSTGVFSAVSDFGNYGHIWGATGSQSIREFLLDSEKDWHYFAKKLDPKDIVDWDATQKRILDHLQSNYREGNYDGETFKEETRLLAASPITDEWSFHNWYQDTTLVDAHEFQVRRLSYQVEMFVKKTMKRLCAVLKVELANEAAGGPPVLPPLVKPKPCKKHPKYRAIYSPRVAYDECRRYYQEKQAHLLGVEVTNGDASAS